MKAFTTDIGAVGILMCFPLHLSNYVTEQCVCLGGMLVAKVKTTFDELDLGCLFKNQIQLFLWINLKTLKEDI